MTAPHRAGANPMDAAALIRTIQKLRASPLRDADFWSRFAQLTLALCRADAAWVVRARPQVATGPDAGPAAPEWEVLVSTGAAPSAGWLQECETVHERARLNGFATSPAHNLQGEPCFFVAINLPLAGDMFLLLEIAERERAMLKELVLRAQLVADLPIQPVPHPRAAAPDQADTGAAPTGSALAPGADALPQQAARLLPLLDLVAQVMQEHRFHSAAMCLVNGLAAQLDAAQAALGWVHRPRVRMLALSHVDRFERNANHVQLIETAMEEALDAQHGVAFDAAAAAPQPLFGHQSLAREFGYSRIRSVVLRRPDLAPVAVVVLAHGSTPGAADAAEQLEGALELMLPWLEVLHARDQWWGRRLAAWLTLRLQRALGPGHTWAKAAGLGSALFAMYALFGTWNYRVEATGQLMTDSTRVISAQFDSRVESATASAGDLVRQGALLSTLDTRELQQQEADLLADSKRFAAEADKARAAGGLAEVEIATARGLQAQAKLARVQFLIGQAVGVAPFDGVVVEGERKDLQGAPVRRGDRLFKIARIEGLYAVLQVPERDIRHIAPNATGELALVTRPDEKIPFRVSSVIPVAQTKGQEGNFFMIRAELARAPEPWWRPGMSGTVRIDAGRRNVAWILTHRVVDAIRMKLWF